MLLMALPFSMGSYEMQLPQFSESESYGKHLSSVRWQIATVAIICKVFATNLWK